MFGCELYALKPDMITVAKGLSSGYLPISGSLISEPIYQACLAQSFVGALELADKNRGPKAGAGSFACLLLSGGGASGD